MTRERHDSTGSRRDYAHRRTDRSETTRIVQASRRYESSGRVSGALSENRPGTDLPFGSVPVVAAEVIGESHSAGLSVIWTVLRDHRRPPPTR